VSGTALWRLAGLPRTGDAAFSAEMGSGQHAPEGRGVDCHRDGREPASGDHLREQASEGVTCCGRGSEPEKLPAEGLGQGEIHTGADPAGSRRAVHSQDDEP
jgi:hypothetical protein